MHKGYMFSKYALDKDLKDVGGLWSRVDFRDYIITPKKVWLANKWFQAGCFLQRPAKGMRRRRKCIKSADGGKVWVTIYEPVNISKNAPCMVYYHGGAFVLRDRPSTHRLAQVYAESIRCKVVIVHYRLGEPYPIPVKDCYRALVWVAHNAEKLGIDKDRIAVVGDSAGGALAAAVTLLARDKNGPSICFQMLINPVTDRSMSYWSMRQFVDSPGWNANLNRQMWDLYLRSGVFGKPQYAAPMCAPSLETFLPLMWKHRRLIVSEMKEMPMQIASPRRESLWSLMKSGEPLTAMMYYLIKTSWCICRLPDAVLYLKGHLLRCR